MPQSSDDVAMRAQAPAGPVGKLADAAHLNPTFANLAAIIPIFFSAVAAGISYAGGDPQAAIIYLVFGAIALVLIYGLSRISTFWQELEVFFVWLIRLVIVLTGIIIVVIVFDWILSGQNAVACLLQPNRSACQIAGRTATGSNPLPGATIPGATTHMAPSATPSVSTATISSVPTEPSPLARFTVFPQYANMNAATVAAMSKALTDKGWNIRPAEDVTQRWAGRWNEVRVSPSTDRAVAARLANDVSAALGGRPIRVQVNASLNPSRPEIWISN